MLIHIEKDGGLKVSKVEVEETTFADLGFVESQVEEFLRRNIEVVLAEETLLIVGQQVINAAKGRSDLVAIDGNGSIVLIEIKRDVADIKSPRVI
jgi:RecB family endonuclease NucS